MAASSITASKGANQRRHYRMLSNVIQEQLSLTSANRILWIRGKSQGPGTAKGGHYQSANAGSGAHWEPSSHSGPALWPTVTPVLPPRKVHLPYLKFSSLSAHDSILPKFRTEWNKPIFAPCDCHIMRERSTDRHFHSKRNRVICSVVFRISIAHP